MANAMMFGVGTRLFTVRTTLTTMTTPWVIERAFAIIVGVALMAFAISVTSVTSMQHAAQQVGHSVKPVISAERLSVVLSDMDAEIAATALDNSLNGPKYRKDIDNVADQIVEINRSIGADDNTADSLRNIMARLWTYFSLANGSEGAAKAASGPLAITAESIDQASQKLRQEIMPEARRAAANATTNLQTAVKTYQERAQTSFLATVLPVTALLAILIATQIFLARRTRRFLNVPLATASLHLAVFLLYFLHVSVATREDLASAKERFFDRLDTLYSADMTANLIRADEEIWLSSTRGKNADQGLGQSRINSFAELARQIFEFGNAAGGNHVGSAGDGTDPTTLDAVAQQLTDAETAATAGQFDKFNPLKGFLGNALQVAARDPDARIGIGKAAQSFVKYLRRAGEIRARAGSGDYAGAVQLCLGTADGGETPIAATTAAIGTVVAADEAAFGASVTSTDRSATTLPFLLAAALSGTIMLAGFGLWQRYTEYR
jgi:hypothetical protein